MKIALIAAKIQKFQLIILRGSSIASALERRTVSITGKPPLTEFNMYFATEHPHLLFQLSCQLLERQFVQNNLRGRIYGLWVWLVAFEGMLFTVCDISLVKSKTQERQNTNTVQLLEPWLRLLISWTKQPQALQIASLLRTNWDK